MLCIPSLPQTSPCCLVPFGWPAAPPIDQEDLPTVPVPRTPPAAVLMFGRRPEGWHPPPDAVMADPDALPPNAELRPPIIGGAATEPPPFDLSSPPPPPIPPDDAHHEVGAGVSVEAEAALATPTVPNPELEAAVFGPPEEAAAPEAPPEAPAAEPAVAEASAEQTAPAVVDAPAKEPTRPAARDPQQVMS